MDEETKQLLRETLEISKQNNQRLDKLVRAQKRANMYRIIYWAIILFFSFGAYYFIQPFLGNLLNIYTGGLSGSSNMSNVTKTLSNQQQMQDFINAIK